MKKVKLLGYASFALIGMSIITISSFTVTSCTLNFGLTFDLTAVPIIMSSTPNDDNITSYEISGKVDRLESNQVCILITTLDNKAPTPKDDPANMWKPEYGLDYIGLTVNGDNEEGCFGYANFKTLTPGDKYEFNRVYGAKTDSTDLTFETWYQIKITLTIGSLTPQ